MKRPELLLTGLFAGSVALSGWYVVKANSFAADSGATSAPSAGSTRVATNDVRMSDIGMTSVAPAAMVGTGAVADLQSAPGSLSDERSLLLQAVSAGDADERASAIEALGGSMSRDALDALGQVVTRDPSARNRHLAVDSLRAMAAGAGDKDGSIRGLLGIATHDADKSVAERAVDAQREVADIVGDGA